MPKNIPADWEPPFPAWSADFSGDNDHVVIVYFGIQYQETSAEIEGFFRLFEESRTGNNAPANVERGRVRDSAGYQNEILVCYWPNQAQYDDWCQNSAFFAWLQDDARTSGDTGIWIESHVIALDKFETLFSSDGVVGAARLSDKELIGPIREHAYWGGMRDRIPRAENNDLPPMVTLTAPLDEETKGRRIKIPAPDNLCVIRSGQNWTDSADKERETYLADVHPTLKEGMAYLRNNPLDSGCLSCRLVSEMDEERNEVQKTFGLAYFTSMAELEAWSKTHPTHMKIFGSFHKLVADFNFQLDLRLWHEVAVLDKAGSYFEYTNCHNRTGIMTVSCA